MSPCERMKAFYGSENVWAENGYCKLICIFEEVKAFELKAKRMLLSLLRKRNENWVPY